MRKTIRLGSSIWFVVTSESGKITDVEEHDMWSGGCILKDPGSSWEQTFVRRYLARGGSEEKANEILKCLDADPEKT